MNILVCEDSRHGDGRNMNEFLCQTLRKEGHSVRLFEGRRADGQEIRDVIEGGDYLIEFLGEWKPTGLILDLQFFNNPEYGIGLLAALDANGLLGGISFEHRCVWSKFEDDPDAEYHDVLVNTYNFNEAQILNRLRVELDEVVAFF